MKYLYGKEVEYKIDIIKPEDLEILQAFSCGNEQLDRYIHKEMISDGEVDTVDGLPFKVTDVKSGKIFSVFSLAASGIIHRVDNYTHVLPAIKIDILAVDVNYQKIHFDEESEKSKDGDDHYYLSDHIMCEIIKKCRYISENYVSAKYIILYADQKARRYYERNYFYDFGKYMEKEHNMEVMENYPMYMELE